MHVRHLCTHDLQKTFDAILATPVNIYDLVAGELMWGAAKSVLYGTIIMIVISALGLVDSAAIIAVLPVLFISGLIFAEISMIFVAIVPGIDSFNYFYTLFMTPMFLFSGIFFPLDGLPPLAAKIAFFTPLYHMVNVCRSFAGSHISAAGWDVLWLVVVALVLAPYPFRLMKKRIVK
ncbi:MAG: ABC transporter permease [Nitrospirota bacterium]|nr:ABC transporter permease [Nitrospirota bacterium]